MPLDMVGVVGSSPIAPTNKHNYIKHLAETLGAFFIGYEKSMKNTHEKVFDFKVGFHP